MNESDSDNSVTRATLTEGKITLNKDTAPTQTTAQALGINTVGQKKVSEQYDNRIYLLDGRYVGTSDANLPKGIYIRNGKKFVK